MDDILACMKLGMPSRCQTVLKVVGLQKTCHRIVLQWHRMRYARLHRLPVTRRRTEEGPHLHIVQRQSAGVSPAQDEKITFIVVDLERFGHINEMLGRHAGDALLQLIAGRLGDRASVARIGADLFEIAVGNLPREADIAHFLEERIMRALSQPFAVQENELRLSAKADVAVYPADGADAETLFRNAQAALKKTKLAGDKQLFYTSELNARMAETLTLENKLPRALEQEQFVLLYSRRLISERARSADWRP